MEKPFFCKEVIPPRNAKIFTPITMHFAIDKENFFQPQEKKSQKNQKTPENNEGPAWETKKECVICINSSHPLSSLVLNKMTDL